MKSYCVQAVRTLSGQQTGATGVADRAGDSTAGAQAQQSEDGKNAQEPELSPADQAAMARKVQVPEEGSKEIAFHRKLADEQIAKAKARAYEGLDNIPKFIYRPPFIREWALHIQIPNTKMRWPGAWKWRE